MKLTDSELSTIVHALRVAADLFEKDAGVCRQMGDVRLREQFERLAAETRAMADVLEQVDGVTLGGAL